MLWYCGRCFVEMLCGILFNHPLLAFYSWFNTSTNTGKVYEEDFNYVKACVLHYITKTLSILPVLCCIRLAVFIRISQTKKHYEYCSKMFLGECKVTVHRLDHPQKFVWCTFKLHL